jgi:4-hydroxy-3-polyprenylbenzoate decarboxylase
MPPVPAFYNKPATIADMVDHTVGRMLDAVGVHHDLIPRWGEPQSPQYPTQVKAD